MKHSILTAALTIIVLASPHLGGQRGAAQTKFQITIGGTGAEIGYSVQQTTDGGYIIAGVTTSFGAGNQDMYLVKTNGSGNISWSRTFGGTGIEYGYSVQQTNDGGYIIAGNTTSFGAGGMDMYLVKTDGSGNLTWSKTFGGGSDDGAYSVQQTSDGGYIITGNNGPWGGGTSCNVYLIKTDGSGNLTWSKTFGETPDFVGLSVKQTSDGGYIIGGWKYGPVGLYDVLLLKADGSGNLTWSKTFGGTSAENDPNMFFRILDIVNQTSDGGYIITGYTKSFGAGQYDVYLVKTDGNGNLTWSKTFGMTDYQYGFAVLQTNDGGYIISGTTGTVVGGNVYLVKTDGSGNLTWSKTYGGVYGYAVRQTSDGGYIITGSSNSNDIYLIKTD